MKPEYHHLLEELIDGRRRSLTNGARLSRTQLIACQCQTFSQAAVQRFPQLRIARGWYSGTEHWWCVEPDGEVVDFTAEQFVGYGPHASYKELDPEKDEMRIGRCMNCGDDIYGLEKDGPACVCSPECERALRESTE